MSGYEDWSLAGWRTHLPGVADLRQFASGLGDETIPALAAAAADRAPDRIAVTVDGEPVTHAELDAAAGRVAAWLAGRVHVGDRVLLAAGSSLGFVRCYLGALRAGAVVVLANPAYTAAELGYLAADSGAVLAFADREPGPAPGRAGGSRVGVRAAADPGRAGTAGRREPRARSQRGNRVGARGGEHAPPAGRRPARLHLGHDRNAQGRAADPPPARGLDHVRDGGVAVERG